MIEGAKYRHEMKYIITEEQFSFLRNRVESVMHLDKHIIDGKYQIRSLYFDDYKNSCYYENENGVDPREKFRVRIYNADDSRISLECKRKEKGKTHKTSCLLSKEDYFDLLNGGGFCGFSNKPPILRKFILLMKTRLYKPVVIVDYERIPYVCEQGNVRVTFDRNICSSRDIDNFFNDNIIKRPILPVGQHLLEIKYDELLPKYIDEVLQTGELEKTAFSKYYLCRKF